MGTQWFDYPPYYCQYNPIELIWAQVKSRIAKQNKFKMADLKHLVEMSLNEVSANDWDAAVRHAEKLQDKDSLSDLAIENFIESFIIHLDETSDEEDFSTVG